MSTLRSLYGTSCNKRRSLCHLFFMFRNTRQVRSFMFRMKKGCMQRLRYSDSTVLGDRVPEILALHIITWVSSVNSICPPSNISTIMAMKTSAKKVPSLFGKGKVSGRNWSSSSGRDSRDSFNIRQFSLDISVTFTPTNSDLSQ